MKKYAAVLIAVTVLAIWVVRGTAQESQNAKDYIEGTVKSAKGVEAGVWVIAETTDLPTKYAKIVVTDDQGRYVLPDLPKANYNVWVRGYGLVDSAKVIGKPGQLLDLTAAIASDIRAAAQYYPPNYWLSIMNFPAGELTPEQLARTATCALGCHIIGSKATREITPETAALGPFKTTYEAWARRLRSGPAGAVMARIAGSPQLKMFADWTDSIASGAVPTEPPRPSGVERNLVLTLWDWGPVNGFIHDAAPANRRNPSIGANGRVYGPSQSNDVLYWVDPVKNTEGSIKIPRRDSDVPLLPRDGGGAPEPLDPKGEVRAASPYWGDENIWMAASEPRSGQMDQKGRIWMGTRIRRNENQPAFCKDGSTNKFASYFPLDLRPNSNIGGKQAGFYDPQTNQWSLIDTCWWFDHNDFADDPDSTLFSGMDDLVGWIDTRVYDETHNDQASQGWCPAVLDTNGDGKITKPWTEPDEPVDASKDHRIKFSCYAVGVNPRDNSAWCNGNGKKLVRIERGPNPPQSCKAELYEVPEGHAAVGSRGVEVDSQGIVWVNFTQSNYIASFDRRKCKIFNGPNATGQQCPEGWTFYPTLDHPFEHAPTVGTTSTYLINVDRVGALGLGKDVPVTYPESTDSLIALSPETHKWVTLRVPYPMAAIYTKQVSVRIDNPKAGWRGRALWANTGSYAMWHIEGGKGTRGKLIKFQFRPDPLAK